MIVDVITLKETHRVAFQGRELIGEKIPISKTSTGVLLRVKDDQVSALRTFENIMVWSQEVGERGGIKQALTAWPSIAKSVWHYYDGKLIQIHDPIDS